MGHGRQIRFCLWCCTHQAWCHMREKRERSGADSTVGCQILFCRLGQSVCVLMPRTLLNLFTCVIDNWVVLNQTGHSEVMVSINICFTPAVREPLLIPSDIYGFSWKTVNYRILLKSLNLHINTLGYGGRGQVLAFASGPELTTWSIILQKVGLLRFWQWGSLWLVM